MVEQGNVVNVLVWRLDRLSRNLGDLILLAEALSKHEVGLHSFTEKLDLSSATGRMFYNILGAFAQFYREQLAENVRLGMHQAARQGKWTNRPKFGYDLIDGELVPNADAPTVRRIFDLRASGPGPQLPAHRGAHRGEVLDGPNDRRLPHPPRSGASQRAVVSRQPRADHQRAGVRGCAPRGGPLAATEPPRSHRTGPVWPLRSGGHDPLRPRGAPPLPVPAPGRGLLPAVPLGRRASPGRAPRPTPGGRRRGPAGGDPPRAEEGRSARARSAGEATRPPPSSSA